MPETNTVGHVRGVAELVMGSRAVSSPPFEAKACGKAFTKQELQFLGVFVTLQSFGLIESLWSVLETLS